MTTVSLIDVGYLNLGNGSTEEDFRHDSRRGKAKVTPKRELSYIKKLSNEDAPLKTGW